MAVKKRVICNVIFILLTAALITSVVIAVNFFKSSGAVIVKGRDMNYYRAENLLIWGDTVICRRDSESSRDRSGIPEENKSRYRFKVLSMKEIVSIEIMSDEETGIAEAPVINPQYLGRYRIHLQGHEGILVMGISKERIYGTVRFTSWGKGAVEYLKGVKIGSGEVRFLRSASTPEEMNRLGANYLFKQKFSGIYSSSGKVIKGFMINDRGERYEWQAERN